MSPFRNVSLRAAALLVLGAVAGAQVNVAGLTQHGWSSDDTRADASGTQPAGTNLKSPVLTAAPEGLTGNSLHDADIFGQILFGAAPGTVPAGTWPGAMHLFIDTAGGIQGKTQISHRKDDATGHGPGSSMGPGFTAQYSWMGNGPTAMTPSLKFGIKTADFGSTPISSRTGENAWDKVLIYEPNNGNPNQSNGVWHTETISFTSGNWWFFDRTVNGSIIGTPMTLSSMVGNGTVFSGAKTIGQVWSLITAPGAKITSVQFGIGSANPGANVYVNQMQSSAYLANTKLTFGTAPLVYDQNVTSNVINGSGIGNGSYTVVRSNGIELGLRGKLRFDAMNDPQDIFNSNGDGTYSFEAGAPTRGAGWVNPATTPFWNVDWSINTDFDGAHPARKLSNLTYQIGMDFDPGPGTNYLVFDPIGPNSVVPFAPVANVPFWDHSIGTNATAQGAGAEAGTLPAYTALLAGNNLAQNSWSPEFFNNAPFDSFNPHVRGRYEFYVAALDTGVEVARSRITIVVEPRIEYDQNVTQEILFGSGVTNGSFTTARIDGLELGLRGKLRFPANNTYNSNGDGTYTFDTGSGTGLPPKSEWSFEWSVNSDADGSTSATVGDHTYRIGMDNEAGNGTNYLVFDPITVGSFIPYTVPVGPSVFWDHSFGNNFTTNGNGFEAANGPTYATYLNTWNVVQNSWQPTFYQNTQQYSWNANAVGRYEYYLAAYSGATELGRTAISIVVTNGTSLVLEADAHQPDALNNLPGAQVVVELHGRNLGGPATGFQAFLQFDSSKLTYVGSASSYSASPFNSHVQSIATANVATGKLRLDGSTFAGSMTTDRLLATLVFTANTECTPASLDFDLGQPFPSVLSNVGVPVSTSLVNSGSIRADITPPVLSASPNIIVAADASEGCDSAVVTFATPTATDNCSTSVAVQCFPPSGTAFPAGETTTVTCVATDQAGNTTTRSFDVTVTATNKVQLSVQLVGVNTAVTRCIRFQLDTCGVYVDVPVTFSASGLFTGLIEVPCGEWTSICAKDRQHTEWDSSVLTLSMDGTTYVAATQLDLEGGDTDDDGDVDIHDVTWLISQFGLLAANGGCPFNGTTRDADFSNNGAVLSEDYGILVANWLTTSACSCSMPDSWAPGRERTETTVIVHDPATRKADLDRNGLVDWRDVSIFEKANGLSHELSAVMQSLTPGH